jgi:hypothetical protein
MGGHGNLSLYTLSCDHSLVDFFDWALSCGGNKSVDDGWVECHSDLAWELAVLKSVMASHE